MKISRGRVLTCIAFTLLSVSAVAGATEQASSTAAINPGLRIVIYGATGRVGSRLVDEALQRGHRVTAVARSAITARNDRDGLRYVQGDVLDAIGMRALVEGQDIVILSVRGSVNGSRKAEDTVQRRSAEVAVLTLRSFGDEAPRLVFVGGAGSLEVSPGVTVYDSISKGARLFMPRSVKQEIAGQILTLEYLRGIDDLRWTYVSPARDFAPGERRGRYRVGGEQLLLDSSGQNRISMEDFAVGLLDECEAGAHIRERISLAY